MGLVDRVEVIKKNPELFDKEGLINRMSEISQLKSQVEQLIAQNKDLQGDLQTARRESVSDRKRIEVEKFKSRLSGVESDKKANNKIQANKLDNAVKLEVERFGSAMKNAQEDLGSVQDIL